MLKYLLACYRRVLQKVYHLPTLQQLSDAVVDLEKHAEDLDARVAVLEARSDLARRMM